MRMRKKEREREREREWERKREWVRKRGWEREREMNDDGDQVSTFVPLSDADLTVFTTTTTIR
jgi:hypothetical protein